MKLAYVVLLGCAVVSAPAAEHGFLYPWMQMSSDCLNIGRALSISQRLLDPDPAVVVAADAKLARMPKTLLDRVGLRMDRVRDQADGGTIQTTTTSHL